MKKYLEEVRNSYENTVIGIGNIFGGNFSAGLEVLLNPSLDPHEIIRVHSNFETRSDFKKFVGGDIEQTLTQTYPLQDLDLSRLIEYFGVKNAGVAIRKFGYDAVGLAIMSLEMSPHFQKNPINSEERVNFIETDPTKTRALLYWCVDQEQEVRDSLWSWYTASNLMAQEFLDLGPEAYDKIANSPTPYPKNFIWVRNLMKATNLDLHDILDIGPSALGTAIKLSYVLSNIDGVNPFPEYYQGLEQAIKDEVVNEWLDHIKEVLEEDTVGGSSYRESA